MPVLIATVKDVGRTVVPGLATEISRRGMAFYAGVPLQAGDVMEVEFQTPQHLRVNGVVRNRSGYCYGVEFLTRLADGPVGAQPKTDGAAKKAQVSYADVCAELAWAEDRLAARLQRGLEANADRSGPEFKRLCCDLLKIRELRRKIEALSPR
jgi:hypothetical protein